MTDMSQPPNGPSASRCGAARTTASSPAPASTPTTSCCRGQTYAYFLRSPLRACAHQVDRHRRAAKAAPGVRGHLHRRRPRRGQVGGLPCGWLINSKDGTPMKEPPHPVLAHGKVRYVGDQVALVVAETLRCRPRTRPS